MLLSGTAGADLPALPPLPAPPQIQQKTAPSFNLAKRLQVWVNIFNGRGCILSETDPARQIQNLSTMISNHRDPTEGPALVEYYNKHIVPHGTAHLAGVPGFGTWAELADKKNASFDWLRANQPKGPADPAEQARAYIAGYQAYTKRAAEDRKYSEALRAASPCHSQDSAPTGRPQGVDQFTSWNHFLTPVQLEQMLAPVRERLVPQRIEGESDAMRVIDEAKTAKLDRLYTYGRLLKNAYDAYSVLERGKVSAERMTWFASLYEGERAAAMANAPKRVAELQTEMAALITKYIPEIKPAKAVGGAPASTAKKVLSGKGILASRATSELRSKDKVTSDERTLTSTTVLVRTYKVAFTAFDVEWVTAAHENWLDVLGLPVMQVCALRHAIVRKYTKGIDVQLNTWLLQQADVLSPMLCKEKASTGALGE